MLTNRPRLGIFENIVKNEIVKNKSISCLIDDIKNLKEELGFSLYNDVSHTKSANINDYFNNSKILSF